MRVLYPGSFDPITNGHLNIIHRASKIFDEVCVAILKNPGKKSLFTIEERIKMIEESCSQMPNIIVRTFDSLTVDAAKKLNCQIIIRGLRAVTDYESEMQMALVNKELNDEIETFFMVADGEYSFLSSSIIKEIASFGGDFKNLVPENVSIKLLEKYGRK
ncbi:MAG: pantetheine-phosphate adenylyltransferase [Gallicola sp.]|nr:pantetheine-phosphate adenylyltransferase [Gallicola sp.]